MVKYEQYIYSTIHDALRKSYDNGGGWDGPDELHHGISATNPPPSWHLSPEGLEYHAECDRDLLDTIIHVLSCLVSIRALSISSHMSTSSNDSTR